VKTKFLVVFQIKDLNFSLNNRVWLIEMNDNDMASYLQKHLTFGMKAAKYTGQFPYLAAVV